MSEPSAGRRPSVASLLAAFHYDPTSGEVRWKTPPYRQKPRLTDVAGTTVRGGYIGLSLKNVKMHAHRVIWAMQTGAWPEGEIDHKDGNRTNNRWENLRVASHAENSRNSSSPGNKTGYRGVGRTRSGRYSAAIRAGGPPVRIGLFATAEEAAVAYDAAALRLHGEFAALNFPSAGQRIGRPA